MGGFTEEETRELSPERRADVCKAAAGEMELGLGGQALPGTVGVRQLGAVGSKVWQRSAKNCGAVGNRGGEGGNADRTLEQ